MNIQTLEKTFAKIGASVEIRRSNPNRRPARFQRSIGSMSPSAGPFSVNVEGTGKREHFVLTIDPDANVEFDALDVSPETRHMILQARPINIENTKNAPRTEKFLCGHDEMHFFAASVPSTVTKVRDAKDRLMPQGVQEHVRNVGLNRKEKFKRKNQAYIRQGEWFFIPEPGKTIDKKFILYNEPLIRPGGGKPHMMGECYREGGTTVWTKGSLMNVLSVSQYDQLTKRDSKEAMRYRQMRRNPMVWCRGKIKHPDHHTIDLGYVWHRVSVNGEIRAQSLGFFD